MAPSFSCFLAHDHGIDERGRDNHERVSLACSRLAALGFTPWFDDQQLVGGGDVTRKMADGIDASACVVIFVTRRFIEKASGSGAAGEDDKSKFELYASAETARPPAPRLPAPSTPALPLTGAARGAVTMHAAERASRVYSLW